MHVIDIRLRQLDQLFDSLDPSPFRDKALSRSAESYLIECAGEVPADTTLELHVHGPLDLLARQADIAAAVHAHFLWLHQQAERRYRRRMRIARFAIMAGLLILALALLLRSWVVAIGGTAGEVLAEGLLILAWVALWRPAEMALFERWEQRQELQLLAQLGRIPLRVLGEATAPAAPSAGAP